MQQDSEHVWMPEVRRLVATGHLRRAFAKLDAIYSEKFQSELFRTRKQIERQARTVWLYKVRILEQSGLVREALAWACLECFMSPKNIAAQAVRNELHGKLHGVAQTIHDRTTTKSILEEWSDIAGMDELKLMIERDIVLPITQAEVYRAYKIHAPNGILLYGPPGCGKTFFARKIADRIGRSFVEVGPSDLASIYVHGSQEKIGKVFAQAKEKAPTVLFFDEIDAMLPRRDGNIGHTYASETNEFLTHLNECHKQQILVVGATNCPDRIDPAALRPGRFERIAYVPPPDRVSREQLFQLYLHERPLAESIDVQKLADETGGYSCADIEGAVNDASLLAAKEKARISMKHLFESLNTTRPSVEATTLEVFSDFREHYGGLQG